MAITSVESATGDQIDIRLGSFYNDTATLLSVKEYEIIGNETFVAYSLDITNTFPNTEVLTLSEAYQGGNILDTGNTLISGTFTGVVSTGTTDYNMTNGQFTNLIYTFYGSHVFLRD